MFGSLGNLSGLAGILSSVGTGLMNNIAPKKRAIKIEDLVPRNPEAKRIRMTWGPLRIKDSNVSNDVTLDVNLT